MYSIPRTCSLNWLELHLRRFILNEKSKEPRKGENGIINNNNKTSLVRLVLSRNYKYTVAKKLLKKHAITITPKIKFQN